ncbi:MAG: GntR family transcriptional regulator [Actinobacteria bacterium]|nr:GntR family transcriptional regulator [Actinomycetota bacterium]
MTAAPSATYEPMAQAVARHIRDAIFSGGLAPGAPIRQESIANELGVSRIPVREALRHLEAEGLVTIRPHSGARVAVLDFDECVEIYKMRERLEPLAFSESAGRLSAAQLDAVRRQCDKVEASVGDVRAWIEADREFHLACYAGADARRLVGLVTTFWNTTQHYRRALVGTFAPADYELFQCDHRLMVAALAESDGRGGENIVRLHIERARLRLAQHMELFHRRAGGHSSKG